jgi:hypothetical protein
LPSARSIAALGLTRPYSQPDIEQVSGGIERRDASFSRYSPNLEVSFYSGNLDSDSMLKISPLTSTQASIAGPGYDNDGGYFLYKTKISDPHFIQILARIESDEAAFQLSRLLGLD